MLRAIWAAAMVVVAGGSAAAQTAGAPDPLAAYPENYRVLLENDRVRVLDFRLARGAREQSHAHPEHVAVFLEDFKIRFTFPDGTQGLREGHPHQVSWSDPVVHASENIGPSDAHGILIELKDSERAGAAEADRAGWVTATTLIHGLPDRADELRAHLLSLAAPTRAEPGCVAYDLYESPTAPNEFMRFEVWTSAEALEAHKQAPHIRASFEKRQREGWSTEIITWSRVPG